MGNYEKLNLANGTPFAAEHVAHMEDGIAAVEAQATAVAGDVAAVAGNVAALDKEVEDLKKNPGTGGGASLPEAGAPNQYLVTDENGNTVWETKPFYTKSPVLYKGYPNYMFGYSKLPFALKAGVSYRIEFKKVNGEIANVLFMKDFIADGNTGEGDAVITNPDGEYSFRILTNGSDSYFYPAGTSLREGEPETSEDGSYAFTSVVEVEIRYTNEQDAGVVPIDPKFLPSGVPVAPVTSADNGKFLQVVNGSWAAVAVANAEEASF